jgi:tetratricopeptide (TPR) repeat protein
LARQHGDPEKAAVALMTLARLARAEGDYSRAVALFEESLAGHALKRGFSAFIQYELGIATIDQGDYPRATAIFQELMTKYQESRWTLPAGLEGLAVLAAVQGASELAARLWGAAEAAREADDLRMDVALDTKDYRRWVSATRAQLDEDAFVAAWAAGRAMTIDEAIAYALGEEP